MLPPMRRDIDIALLRAFLTVAETGGMTTAGRLLNLTQAAVSQQIKRLEELFEAPLFHRDTKSLTLTSTGERLISHARELVQLNDQVFSAMREPEFEGDVRLGVPHDIFAPYMPPILRSFHSQYPRIRLSMVGSTTPRLLTQLQRGEVDITLTTEVQPASGPDMLLREPLIWAGAIDGKAARRNPLPVSLGDDSCAFRAHALEALRKANRSWQIVCEVSDTAPLLTTLRADLAVSPLMQSTVPNDLEVVAPQAGLPKLPPFHINLYQAPSAGNGIIAALANHIREEFQCRHSRAA